MGWLNRAGPSETPGGNRPVSMPFTREGEELFPKAYALVLGGLVEEIARNEGRERAAELLGAVGRRTVGGKAPVGDAQTRVEAAAAALRGLGGDVDVHRTELGWHIEGFGCPLSAVTAEHAEVCSLARAIVEEITGQPVIECCDRTDRPRCGFRIDAPSVAMGEISS